MNPGDPPSRIRALPSWQLSRVAARAARLVSVRAAELGVTRSTYSSLAALEEFGPSSQAELGRQVGLDRKDVSSLIAGLEADGLVLRESDSHDRRRNVIEITAAGRALLERLDEAFTAAQDDLLAVLSVRDRAQLARLLEALNEGD